MKKEKTIKEWLMMLPIEYRRRAFYNCIVHGKRGVFLDDLELEFCDAVCNAFTWAQTVEGEKFWEKVSRWNPTPYLPPIPEE